MSTRGRHKHGRSEVTYAHKVAKIKKWYERVLLYREEHPEVINENTKEPVKRKELKELSYYIGLLKQVSKK